MKTGIIFRAYSFWIGFHYSPFHRRWCINLIPMLTIWITLEGGTPPTNQNKQLINKSK